MFSRISLGKILRFAIVGLGATLVYYLGGLLGLYVGLSVFWAHWIAYFVSQASSYLGQKAFTFEVRGEHKKSLQRYVLAVSLITLSQFLFILILQQNGVDDRVSLLLSALYYPPVSFVIHNLWTFNIPSPRA